MKIKKKVKPVQSKRVEKQIFESKEVIKNAFNIDRSGVSLLFNRLVKEQPLEFSNIKDKIDPKNLVYIFKTGQNESKDFGNYQMPLKLVEDLRDRDINPKVLKNQARFVSDLSEIKVGDNKSINQKNMIKNITTFFDLREKIIDFF